MLSSLHPWFVTGLTDAEGSFSFSINKSKTAKFGYSISPYFGITMHMRDMALLIAVKKIFGVGGVEFGAPNLIHYRVRDTEELIKITNHFKFYPLISFKRNMFYIFITILNMYSRKEHLTVNGFLQALAYIK